MSANLFTALFLVLLTCGTLCGHVCAAVDVSKAAENEKVVELFQTGTISGVPKPNESTKITINVNDYYSLVFLSAGDVFVALAGVYRKSQDDKYITVLTRYIFKEGNDDWKTNMFKTSSGDGEWKTQLAAYDECSTGCVAASVVKGLAAAAKDSKIYLFSVNASASSGDGNDTALDFKFVEGDVDTRGKQIAWNMKAEQITLPEGQPKLTDLIKGQQLSKKAFSVSALVKDEKVIFLLRIETNDKKNVFVFFKFDKTTSSSSEKVQFLSSNEVAKGCYPYVFLWESKIIVIPTQCTEDASNQKIKEITDVDKKEGWKDSSGPFHLFVDFFKDKSDFTTANIKENNKVLLFIQKIPKKEQPGNNDVYLWVTDGNHSYRAKEPFTDVSTAPISLFYKDNELLALYQKWEEQTEPKKIVLRQLKTQLDDITLVIEAWGKIPQIVKRLCDDKILCNTPPPTDGLVGFLHNIISDDTKKEWKDEYYFSNATVEKNNVENATNGFKFNGKKAGAKWSIKNQNGDQQYNFTDPGFSLVATVTIDGEAKDDYNSVLGIGLEDIGKNSKSIGLWCSKAKQWTVKVGKNTDLKESTKECIQGKTYSVTLFYKKGETLKIYVNGEELTYLDNGNTQVQVKESITHFYFGANTITDGGAAVESHVTVTNVLLYNRPFNADEIDSLKKYIKSVEVVTPLDGNTQEEHKNNTGSGSDQQTPPTLPASPSREEKAPSPSRTEDGGVGGGVRVFSLLLAVLCVSAPLLHL